MKIFLIALNITVFLFSQSSIYDLQFSSLEGKQINMADFKNKKLIIVVFNALQPDFRMLTSLDSLQKNSGGTIAVIGIPANEQITSLPAGMVTTIRDSLKIDILLTPLTPVKRASGVSQHPLLKWLTDVNQNKHYDYDADDSGEVFIINERGILHGVLSKGVSRETLLSTLNATASE